MKTLYVLGIVVVAIAITNCAPIFDNFDDEIEKLFQSLRVDCTNKFNCPQDTTSCSKNTTTSADRETISTEIKCFNSDGQLLNGGDTVSTKPNNNPNGVHNSYEYYGTYTGGSNTVHTTNYGSSNPNTNIETFDN